MPIHGKATSVIIGGVDFSLWLNSISTSESVETAETTPFQTTDKTYIVGQADAKVDFGGRWESDVVGKSEQEFIRQQLLAQRAVNGLSIPVLVGWGMGIKAGNPCEYGKTLITSWQITNPADGLVTASGNTVVDGGLGSGVLLLDKAAISATTTGTTQQTVIPTGAMWGAVFHLLSNANSGTTAFKIQTSTDGSTWVDLAGASYTFPTGATNTGAVLVSGVANTAGAFVRAVVTLGGTGAVLPLAAFGLY